ncbi:primosomal replication protein N [Ferrigenium kumadai]|uniref:Replication restart protein PriB n=1 Tax=Ferrigenium kumadai TaxID=1682490 RepID=A0AAN1VZK2_9PROT|nr:primosomal replication protein N [Ferrigenium kumadai]BBI99528.1 primosomal replication protein N [Ferrigenium kumadai]
MRNQVVISGELIALEGLRYTPAGVARVALTLRHSSQQSEADGVRQVQCEVDALAFAGVAEKVTRFAIGQSVKVRGFLAQRSMRSRQLVLHINDIILE